MQECKKHGVERFVSVPSAEHGTAEKIADMFVGRAETSFMQDIAPVLLEKYQYRALDARLCTMASEDIDRAFDIARHRGYIFKSVPQFKPSITGTTEVADIVYKRIEEIAAFSPT